MKGSPMGILLLAVGALIVNLGYTGKWDSVMKAFSGSAMNPVDDATIPPPDAGPITNPSSELTADEFTVYSWTLPTAVRVTGQTDDYMTDAIYLTIHDRTKSCPTGSKQYYKVGGGAETFCIANDKVFTKAKYQEIRKKLDTWEESKRPTGGEQRRKAIGKAELINGKFGYVATPKARKGQGMQP